MKLESLMYCGALPIRRAASPGDFERNVATTFIMWGCESVGRDLWAQFSLDLRTYETGTESARII